MGSLSVLQFSEFASLPYSVQEHIIDLINHYDTYISLAVTCKYLSELCVRSLYHTLEFSASDIGKKRWPELQPITQFNHVRLLQYVYVQTLEAKPELAAFTQHITWDISDDWFWPPAEEISVRRCWGAFELLKAVRTLDLRVRVASYTSGPLTSLFPNLVQARVEGTYPQDALKKILLNSPYIKQLTITPNTKEYLHRPNETHAYGTGIESFLRASISQQAFRGLRTLDIGLDSGVNPELATWFIEMSAERIEELWIEYNFGEPLTAYENWVIPMLETGKWRRLRKLGLLKVIVPNDPIKPLERYCPALEGVVCER